MKRREFLRNLGIITGAGTISLSLSGIPIKAFARPLLNINSFNGKVLVLIQLKGGNDGLNTVVPIEDSIYYNNRPTLSIEKETAVKLNDITGLHPSLLPFKDLYDNGKLNIIQNVGYDNPNRSHFRSTDIWLSGSDSEQFIYDGWVGRYLHKMYSSFPDETPDHPMAIQLGSVQSLLFEGPEASMGVAFQDPNTFFQLVQGSEVDNDPPPDTIAGEELKFLKQIAAQSIQYADVIKEIADKNENKADYPDTNLATQLKIVADLIGGGMETPCYLTTISGFDTHATQADIHSNLLQELADAVSAFQTDLELMGVADKVVTLTISEFGRRVAENGSEGTDHGSAAPMFAIGQNLLGGFTGDNPNLSDLDDNFDIKHKYDFRQVYATMLQDHLGLDQETSSEVLLKEFETLPIINTNVTSIKDELPTGFALKQNYPNPFNPATKIDYSIAKPGHVSIIVYDSLGRIVKKLINGYHQVGNYAVVFNSNTIQNRISSGTYFYRIKSDNFVETKKMLLVK